MSVGDDAKEYVALVVVQRTGHVSIGLYRSESEWEYVARAGTSTTRQLGIRRDQSVRLCERTRDNFNGAEFFSIHGSNLIGTLSSCDDGYTVGQSPVRELQTERIWSIMMCMGNVMGMGRGLLE